MVTRAPDGTLSTVVKVEHRPDDDPVLAPLLRDARAAWATARHPGWQLAGATTDEVMATGSVYAPEAAQVVSVQPIGGVCRADRMAM